MHKPSDKLENILNSILLFDQTLLLDKIKIPENLEIESQAFAREERHVIKMQKTTNCKRTRVQLNSENSLNTFLSVINCDMINYCTVV